MTFFFGALSASLMLVLGARVAHHEPLGGHSWCDSCRRQLRLSEVVPVWSWLRARGRTSCCGVPLSRAHVTAEMLGGLWCAAAAAVGTAGQPALGWVLAGAGIGLLFTRAFRHATAGAWLAGPSCDHSTASAGVGMFRVFGALRCGWCGRSVVGA